jgi:hypothetical protein
LYVSREPKDPVQFCFESIDRANRVELSRMFPTFYFIALCYTGLYSSRTDGYSFIYIYVVMQWFLWPANIKCIDL